MPSTVLSMPRLRPPPIPAGALRAPYPSRASRNDSGRPRRYPYAWWNSSEGYLVAHRKRGACGATMAGITITRTLYWRTPSSANTMFPFLPTRTAKSTSMTANIALLAARIGVIAPADSSARPLAPLVGCGAHRCRRAEQRHGQPCEQRCTKISPQQCEVWAFAPARIPDGRPLSAGVRGDGRCHVCLCRKERRRRRSSRAQRKGQRTGGNSTDARDVHQNNRMSSKPGVAPQHETNVYPKGPQKHA